MQLFKWYLLILLHQLIASSTSRSSSSSSGENDDSLSSTDEMVPIHKSVMTEGQHGKKLKHVSFANLRKDDDLLPLKNENKKKNKKKHEIKKIRIKRKQKQKGKKKKQHRHSKDYKDVEEFFTEKNSPYICASRNRFMKEISESGWSGDQSVGFTYNKTWHKSVENKGVKKNININIKSKSKSNGYDKEKIVNLSGEIKNPIGFGWWIFSFSLLDNSPESEATSGTTFKFVTKRRIIVSVVDLFCRGDSFSIYDLGHLMAQSSRVRPDPQCKRIMISPQDALEDGRWSSVVFELEPGQHEIGIKPLDNPFKEGFAAIRFEELEGEGEEEVTDKSHGNTKVHQNGKENRKNTNKTRQIQVSRRKVCRGYNGYVVISSPFIKSEAATVCNSLNTKLASVNEKNRSPASILPLTKSLEKCIGTDSKAWVSGHQNRNMLLNTKGSLMTDSENNGKYPIICQVKN